MGLVGATIGTSLVKLNKDNDYGDTLGWWVLVQLRSSYHITNADYNNQTVI